MVSGLPHPTASGAELALRACPSLLPTHAFTVWAGAATLHPVGAACFLPLHSPVCVCLTADPHMSRIFQIVNERKESVFPTHYFDDMIELLEKELRASTPPDSHATPHFYTTLRLDASACLGGVPVACPGTPHAES
jgi:hypothetical protein